jgi:hypothetical protein
MKIMKKVLSLVVDEINFLMMIKKSISIETPKREKDNFSSEGMRTMKFSDNSNNIITLDSNGIDTTRKQMIL